MIASIKENSSKQAYSYLSINIHHAYSCECMIYLTYLTASQHLNTYGINAWTCHGIKTKKQKINPNLTCEKQINNKEKIYVYEKRENRGITCEINKENKVEIQIKVSKQRYACTCKGLCAWAKCMHAHTLTWARMQDAWVRRLA